MLNSTSLSSWEVYYENKDNKLTSSFYNLLEQYEADNFKLNCRSVRLDDEPAHIRFCGKLSNVDVILLFKRIFQDHPEYKEGCTRFSAMSELKVIESIDMKPLLEIF